MTEAVPERTQRPTGRWIAGCLVATGVLLILARSELQRVEQTNLFLFAVPWDAPASPVETVDARITARDYAVPAFIFLLLIGLVATFAGSARLAAAPEPTRLRFWLTLAFLLSVLADLATTLWFFHDGGIDLELHPGIRLFGYAYGRTTGPIAGKIVQAVGILLVSRISRRGGVLLLGTVTCVYAAAAIYNASQMSSV